MIILCYIVYGDDMEIECTKKLLDKLKIKPIESKCQEDVFSWHVNINKFGRGYICVMTNNELFIPVIAFPLFANEFKHFEDVMKNAMYEAFVAFGLTEEECADYFNTAGEWNYTKTHSKQIIGINNQQYFDATWGQEYILDGQTSQPVWSKWIGGRVLLCNNKNTNDIKKIIQDNFK